MKDDRGFKFLLDKIRRNRDIDFSQYRPQVLKRRIRQRPLVPLAHWVLLCLAVRSEEALVALEASAHLQRRLHPLEVSVALDHKASQSTKP